MRRYVCGKWKKTLALMQNEQMKQYIPQTVRMTSESLLSMLKQYKMVYIKPDIGTFGNGVMRVEWVDNEGAPVRYQYKSGVELRIFHSFEAMYQDIERRIHGKSYLAQKGIHLLKFREHNFDIRVMVQQNSQNMWESTGLIGRVGQLSKVVTNYHSGGTPKAVELLLSPYLSLAERNKYIQKLKKMGTAIAKQMHRKYPGVKEIGIDVAVDQQLKPWILEVNTKPDPYIFKKLQDKSVFGRIIRYARLSQSVKSQHHNFNHNRSSDLAN